MKHHDDDMLPALRSVGDQLHEAARRELAPMQRRRRRRRRVLAIAVGLLLLDAAVAGAARLIAVGEPVDDTRQGEGLGPRSPGQIVVRASDPDGGLPWAGRAYTNRDGRECILVGRQRGFSLGVIRDDTFHAYRPDARGVWGDLAHTGLLQSAVTFTEPQVRTVVFGRTKPGATSVRVEGPGRPHDVRVGPAGAFLLLYDGRVAANPGARHAPLISLRQAASSPSANARSSTWCEPAPAATVCVCPPSATSAVASGRPST